MANGTATLTQGLQQYTLVAGKTTALRMFADASTLANAHLIEATVVRPGGSQVIASWTQGEFVAIPQSSLGPSIVVRLAGSLLRWIGIYTLDARIADGNGVEIASYQILGANFLPTKDLRVMVSRLWSGTPTKPGEDEAAHAAMQRMSALFPVRDGMSRLNGDRNAGLRYNLDDNPMGPPNQDGHLCPLFASYLNRPPTEDSIDVGITFRFPNPGEGSGGNAGHHCPNQSLLFSVIVWGAPLANVFCQETAHGFGLEPAQDPHLDPIHGPHSKDVTIDAQDAELGFDIQYNQAWPQPTYDVMYWEGPDPEHPDPSISLNSWDWEYLRQQIAALPSTGPGAETIHLDTLTQFGIGIVGLTGYYAKDDGAQHVIVGTTDGTLTEVYWKPAQGVHQDLLARFNNIVGIAGYYAKDDDTQHVMVGTSDANLTEVYWKPAQGVHQDVLTHFTSSIVGIGGYYAGDDDAQHAIVATSDGALTEVYWRPS